MQVDLPDDVLAMIRERIASGRYAAEADVVREALRVLARDEWEREMWNEGEASGDGGVLDWDELRREAEARLRRA
jgi:antitoxin ParD1/3/4